MYMNFRSLHDVPVSTLAATFNLAFSDYVVPFQLTETQLQNKLISDGVRPDLSAGAFEQDELVGFILHGYDVVDGEAVAYNAGTGVIPEKRGQKLTARLYDFVLPELKNAGVQSVHLEVISSNQVAFNTYRKTGFEVARELDCYKGTVTAQPQGRFEVRSLETYDWPLLQSFWHWQPSWQNSITAVENVRTGNISLGAWAGSALAGYLIYNPVSNRIQQFAVHPGFRRQGVATQLFAHTAQLANKELVLINVDHNSAETAGFLRALGFQQYILQFEMRLAL
jgi:ribosomal protein S18 acetylase RimI-like enzyme